MGGNDPEVLALNQQAYELLACPKKLEIIPGATHLFEEAGCLAKVAKLSAAWLIQYFSSKRLD